MVGSDISAFAISLSAKAESGDELDRKIGVAILATKIAAWAVSCIWMEQIVRKHFFPLKAHSSYFLID